MNNRLTLFLETLGHGFIGLNCESCADGKPAEIKAGFYPKSDFECTDKIEAPRALAEINQSLRQFLQVKFKTLLPASTTLSTPAVRNHPVPASVVATIGSAVNPNTQYMVLNEEEVDGKTRCNASDDGINFVSHSNYFKAQLDNFYRVSYEINSEDSIKIYQRIKELAESEVPNYDYAWIGHNCLDFTKDIYELTSLEKKSLCDMYNFNPLVSMTGINGVSATYMAYRDTYDAASSNPVLTLFTGFALFGLYKWSSNKLSRRLGPKFNPNSITEEERYEHLSSFDETKKVLLKAIQTTQDPLIRARNAMNDAYNTPSRKDEYEQIKSFYEGIKGFIKTCEESLALVKQLEQDYDSLSKEYCSTSYAAKTIDAIKGLSKIRQSVEDTMPKMLQDQADNQLKDKCKQPMLIDNRHKSVKRRGRR